MAISSTVTTAGEVMDRSAVLMNDPLKTDYTYAVLTPFLKMALDELTESLVDSQANAVSTGSFTITLPKGQSAIWAPDIALIGLEPGGLPANAPFFPAHMMEIQQVAQRPAGDAGPYIPVKRKEFSQSFEVGNMSPGPFLGPWAWDNNAIRFPPIGANRDMEIQVRHLSTRHPLPLLAITPDSVVGTETSRSFLAYKTAAYAAQFIGENTERAAILDAKAEKALDRIESIDNKGRQQIMTRHRPFRAAYKMRGGY